MPSSPSGRPSGLCCRLSDPLTDPQTSLAGPQSPLAGTQTPLAGPWIPPAGPWIPQAGPHTPLPSPQTALTSPQTCSAGPLTPLDKWMDGWTDRRIDRISLHPTGLCSLLGPLPCYHQQLYNIQEAGQGSCGPHDTFGQLVLTSILALLYMFFMMQVPWISFAYCHLMLVFSGNL